MANLGNSPDMKLSESLALKWALGGYDAGISPDHALLVARDMIAGWIVIIRKSAPVGAFIAVAVFLTFHGDNDSSYFYIYIIFILLSYAVTLYLTAVWKRTRVNIRTFSRFFYFFSLCRLSMGTSWALALIHAAMLSNFESGNILYGIGIALISMPMFGGSLIFSMLFWLPVTIGFGVSFFVTPYFAGDTAFVAYLMYSLLVLLSLINTSKKAIELSLTSVKLRSVSDYLSVAIAELEEQTSDWLWKTDASLAIVEASPGFRKAVGNGTPLNGMTVMELFPSCAVVEADTSPGYRYNITIIDKITRHESFSKELVAVCNTSEVRWWRLSGRPQFDDNRIFTGYIGVGTDVTMDCNLKQKTEYLANHDALTGLVNRHRLSAVLNDMHDSCGLVDTAVVVIDLDYFKQVNDKHGHHVGDELLSLVGKRLIRHIRAEDCAARLGGDEFCVVLRKVEVGEAETISRRILESLKEPYEIQGLRIVIGASAGFAFASSDQRSADELLRLADVAALQAKNERRGQLAVFGGNMLDEHRRASTLRSDLISAIENNQFELVFQPIFDLRLDAIVRQEALLRWIHPAYGVVGPDEFIEFAEATGVIIRIDEWVLDQALARFTHGDAERIAINISSYSLFAPGFLERVHKRIRENQMLAHFLEIEITETSILRLTEDHEESLKALRKMGVTLALDDFGTGQSSLARLGAVQCDRIKIDRSLTVTSIGKYRRETILRSVVKLAQAIGVSVCIEGIQDSETLTFCREIGADEGQGFYLGRPSEVSVSGRLQPDLQPGDPLSAQSGNIGDALSTSAM